MDLKVRHQLCASRPDLQHGTESSTTAAVHHRCPRALYRDSLIAVLCQRCQGSRLQPPAHLLPRLPVPGAQPAPALPRTALALAVVVVVV